LAWYDYKEVKAVARKIDASVWCDRSCWKRWFVDFGMCFVSDVHNTLTKDEEIFMWISQNCRWTNQLRHADAVLRQDEPYMIQLFEANKGTSLFDGLSSDE